jgi:hypothetical protein
VRPESSLVRWRRCGGGGSRPDSGRPARQRSRISRWVDRMAAADLTESRCAFGTRSRHGRPAPRGEPLHDGRQRQIRGSVPSHPARVLEVRIHLPPAESVCKLSVPRGFSAPARPSAAQDLRVKHWLCRPLSEPLDIGVTGGTIVVLRAGRQAWPKPYDAAGRLACAGLIQTQERSTTPSNGGHPSRCPIKSPQDGVPLTSPRGFPLRRLSDAGPRRGCADQRRVGIRNPSR